MSIFRDSKLLSDPVILICESENIILISNGPTAWPGQLQFTQVIKSESFAEYLLFEKHLWRITKKKSIWG